MNPAIKSACCFFLLLLLFFLPYTDAAGLTGTASVTIAAHKGKKHSPEYHQAVFNYLTDQVRKGKAEAAMKGLAGDTVKDIVAEKITEGLLEIADDICNKKTGKWSKLLF